MLSTRTTQTTFREEQLDLVFKALCDKTRRELLSRLSQGSVMITELAAPFEMSLPAVSKHLRVLEKAGLVERTVNGRVHSCALNVAPLKTAGEWLQYYEKFWSESLNALSAYVQTESQLNNNSQQE